MINKQKLSELLKDYKVDLPEWLNGKQDEKFKWRAVKHFNDVFDLEAEDLSAMFEDCLGSKYLAALLVGPNRFPAGMIKEFAKYEPEFTKEMFTELYDESKDLMTRIEAFKQKSDDILHRHWGNGKNHYQNDNAITTYLWLRYPDKYYIYKNGIYKLVAKELESPFPFIQGRKENVTNGIALYDEISEEMRKDEELGGILQSNLDDSCYPDPYLRTLAIDFGHYLLQKERQKDTDDGAVWIPENYDPGISVEKWKELIANKEVFSDATLDVMKSMLDNGGQGSCKELASKYGKDMYYYRNTATQMAMKVQKATNCPISQKEEGGDRYWAIPFVGRYSKNDELGGFIWKLRPELQEALEDTDLSNIPLNAGNDKIKDNMGNDIAKNTILYGPPGTGKTYNTARYAVSIIENKQLKEMEKESYPAIIARYNQYKEDGLIEFTTFHQAYGYEEFIEGIRPVMDAEDEGMQYRISSGVFKTFCEKAATPVFVKKDLGLNANPVVWKVSLEGTGDNPTRTECMENDHIRIGWDDYGETITDDINYSEGGKAIIDAFINKMRVGDIVFSCYTSTMIDAIGVVTGEYEWVDSYEQYKRVRAVKWLAKGLREDITEINNGKTMTLSTVYQLHTTAAEAMALLSKVAPEVTGTEEKRQNYVFIIDEINRGNISKIFGELITLIEEPKRVGKEEGMTARLPYSKTMFGVPENVYLIGTMNTADRSIATLDTALRRRFDFVEMLPNTQLFEGLIVEGIYIKEMLDRMNKKIEVLYDREHTLGHAYFIPLLLNPTIGELKRVFQKKIIPLLQEYFFEDYEKIRLVLNDNNKDDEDLQFIKACSEEYGKLFGKTDFEFDDSVRYEINEDAFDRIEAYKQIYSR